MVALNISSVDWLRLISRRAFLFVYVAISRVRGSVRDLSPAGKFQLMVLLWAVFGFSSSRSSTKFHHYIFPVIPPLAILCALFLEAVLARSVRHGRLLLITAAALTLWSGNLYRMPAQYGQVVSIW